MFSILSLELDVCALALSRLLLARNDSLVVVVVGVDLSHASLAVVDSEALTSRSRTEGSGGILLPRSVGEYFL